MHCNDGISTTMMKGFAEDGNRTSARGSSVKFGSVSTLFCDDANILSESGFEREENLSS